MSKFLMTALVAAATGALGLAASASADDVAKGACCCGEACTCEKCDCSEGCDDCKCDGCGCASCTDGGGCCDKK